MNEKNAHGGVDRYTGSCSMDRPILVPFADAEELAQAAARAFVHHARAAIHSRGKFTTALSGGSTPKRLFELLAAPPFASQVDWSRVHLFWGDERSVPPDHPESNYATAAKTLLPRVGIPAGNVHRLEAERPDRAAAARDYQAKLATVLGAAANDGPPSLDLVLLGMGPDGHTASLFPGNAALGETHAWVVPVHNSPKPPPERLSLTLPLINRARTVLFLVGGADKADTLYQVLEGAPDGIRYPSQLVKPADGQLIWYLDRAAAAKLPREKLDSNRVKLAPSILAADFACLGDQVKQAEAGGAERIHVDVMDGHFVPNISFGALVVKAIRPVTDLPLECHLMIAEPDRYIEDFVAAGADTILVHVENNANLHRTIHLVKQCGKKAGVVLNPATSPVTIAEVLADVELVLVMTVNPGFGGQSFIPGSLGKIKRVRQMINQVKPELELEIDGGVDAHTIPGAFEAGARVLVAGSSIFAAKDGIAAAMEHLRAAAATKVPD